MSRKGEDVGRAFEIYVVTPAEGKLVLTKGAVFSYYEFTVPIEKRMTDEEWQRMLREGRAPPLPKWCESFISKLRKSKIPEPEGGLSYYFSDSGC